MSATSTGGIAGLWLDGIIDGAVTVVIEVIAGFRCWQNLPAATAPNSARTGLGASFADPLATKGTIRLQAASLMAGIAGLWRDGIIDGAITVLFEVIATFGSGE